MKTLTEESFSPEAVVAELLDGSGAVLLPGLFDDDQVERAREIVVAATDDAAITGSHFNQSDEDELLQRRVWNLFSKGEIFCEMVQHPSLVSAMRAFLGSDFIVGSMCASRTMPGFEGQEPHLDYPYWDFHREHSFPARINSSFPLNAQCTIVIDPFTEESGATAYRPGSQREMHYPDESDDFFDDYELMLAEPGDVVLFYGLTWHCAMPNRSDAGRIGLLVEFLPKFVTPIEDLTSELSDDWLANATPTLRQMLGFEYPWPSSPPHPPLLVDPH